MKMKKRIYFPLLLTLLASLVFGVLPVGSGVAYANPGWVSPTGNVPNGWIDPANAHDENTLTYATFTFGGAAGWGNYIELTLDAAIFCDRVQIWSDRDNVKITQIEVDVYYSDGWKNIYSGLLVVGSYQEYVIGSTQSVTKMQVRYYQDANKLYIASLYEAACWEVPPDISNDSATGNNYAFGTVDAGSSTKTGLTYFTVTNNSAFNVNITISGSDMEGGVTWTLSEDASTGTNIYGLRAGRAGEVEGNDYLTVVPKSSANPLVSDLAGEGGTQQWGLQFLAPDTFTDGGSKSGTVTLTATQA
ncbi:MAG: hypothetical protein D4S01_03660 [Dehalococcoidia bacterium]|nr:MAG: hypothetical protein D4S01_03660 [Dehalococcoidia bacterium]